MELLEAIRRRRAVRDFRPENISAGMIHQLISAASWAPSAMNAQPWHFTVITEPSVLDEISAKAKDWMLANIVPLPREDHFRDTLADPAFHLFYHAPALVVISTAARDQWAREDCALAAQNLMLAAVPMELGTCWIGFAQSWLNTDEGKDLLNLGRDMTVVAPIIVGHPKVEPPSVPRKQPAVSWIGHRAPAKPRADRRARE